MSVQHNGQTTQLVEQQVTEAQLVEEFGAHVFQHIDLTPDALQPLLKFAHTQQFSTKAFLLHAGERWNKLFYIQRGLVRLFYTDVDGREFNKAFFGESACIWPVAPSDRDRGVLFSIAPVEETVIVACSFPVLHDFLSQQGCWEAFALPFAETLVEQKFQREYEFLLLSATERYKQFLQTHPNFAYRIPDYHLASFLGITNVSLSRIKRAAYNKK